MNRNSAMLEFMSAMKRQAHRKEKLYDGLNQARSSEFWMTCLAEETGEVAAALIRSRKYNAVAECLDLAHTAMLLAISLDPDAVLISGIANEALI